MSSQEKKVHTELVTIYAERIFDIIILKLRFYCKMIGEMQLKLLLHNNMVFSNLKMNFCDKTEQKYLVNVPLKAYSSARKTNTFKIYIKTLTCSIQIHEVPSG